MVIFYSLITWGYRRRCHRDDIAGIDAANGSFNSGGYGFLDNPGLVRIVVTVIDRGDAALAVVLDPVHLLAREPEACNERAVGATQIVRAN